ncbi:MAG: CDP-alcohol phosphatidyltransferase family protein [Gemmatimonadota bacterium]|nr:CDP-alcohol phosphatidyltransferase family protein [Gemmatimonadota bacterium]
MNGPGFLTVSNVLSLLRIPLGAGFLAVRDPAGIAAIIAVGAVTDLLDGAVARLTNTRTEIGALLDPFCDRVFVFLGLVSFLPGGGLDWAGFLILILRDLFTGGVFIVARLTGQPVPFHSRAGGRVTTALQVVALFTLVFAPAWVKLPVILVGITSVYAILDYGAEGIRVAERRAARGT